MSDPRLGRGHILVAGPAGVQGCGQASMVYCGLCRQYFHYHREGDKGREPCPYAKEFGDCFACHEKGTDGHAVPLPSYTVNGFLCNRCLNSVEYALVVLGRVQKKGT